MTTSNGNVREISSVQINSLLLISSLDCRLEAAMVPVQLTDTWLSLVENGGGHFTD